jgi:proton glutamate symport protein
MVSMISLPLVVRILEDPRTILGGVVLGFVFGFFLKEFSLALAPAGTIYIYLLSMCLLPIIVTAMIWGIGQMLRDPATRPLFGRLGLAYALGFIVSVAVAIVVAIVIGPGVSLSDEAVTRPCNRAC